MRKVTAGLFHSVDGVVQDPFKFQFDSFDDELGKGLTKMINTVDTVVLGRVSYQEWAGYWPNASRDEDFAAFINPGGEVRRFPHAVRALGMGELTPDQGRCGAVRH